MIDRNYSDGVIYGVLVGIISAVIVLLISLFGLSEPYAAGVVGAGFVAIITVLIFAVVIGGIMGIIGGIIGVTIKKQVLD